MMTSDHFDGKRFFNPGAGPNLRSFREVLRWKMQPRPQPWPVHDSEVPVWTSRPVEPGQVAVTYVGQDTFLLQLPGGVNLLTDPHWSDRASPLSWFGPRRVRRPAIRFEDLPPIAGVMVSHNHYDHLDLPTLRRLEAAHHPRFFVPLANRRWLGGPADVVELDWWGDSELAGYRIMLVPAQHWSNRWMFDRNRSLWGGFAVLGPGMCVYFSGDTGYNEPMFQEIGERVGPVSLSLLPIGTYEPRWFMHPQHMNPDDSVRAHIALGSRQSLGMHVATFQLADEPFEAPYVALQEALAFHRVEPERFRPPQFGITELFGTEPF